MIQLYKLVNLMPTFMIHSKNRICVCDTIFEPKSPNQRYCSKTCVSFYRRKYLEMKNIEKRIKRKKLREKALNLIGRKCLLCNHEKVVFHEIHGKDHYSSNYSERMEYYIKQHKNFVPLCRKHHTSLHQIIDEVENLELLIQLIRNLA